MLKIDLIRCPVCLLLATLDVRDIEFDYITDIEYYSNNTLDAWIYCLNTI